MNSWFRFTFATVLVALFAPLLICGQSAESLQSNQPSAAVVSTVHGVIRDSQNKPVSGAGVFLQDEKQSLTTKTDATGAYRFSSVPAGHCTLRAESSSGTKAATEFVLAESENRTIDLILPLQNGDHPLITPEFYDEPHFTVAGVTDTTNMGGHGSSVAGVRNTESIVKAAASLSDSSGKSAQPSTSAQSEVSLRLAVQQSPDSFDANYQLGKLLVEEGKPAESIAYLKRASAANPRDYENHYELALAYCKAADYSTAKAQMDSLLDTSGKPEQQAAAHHLLGEIDEKSGDALAAVREFQSAAELNTTEPNLFDWGSELLLHRAAEPAIEVFTKGGALFPKSVRMLTALGAAWFAMGSQEKAAESLCKASDLDPEDPNPYLFMGKAQATEAQPSPEITERLKRFVALRPRNALANYYYAVSLWKDHKSSDDNLLSQIQSLLMKSVELDPKLGEAYLQLGMVYAEQKRAEKAISAYKEAIAASPDLAEAHYRLAQAYWRAGDSAKAQAELQQYESISKEKTEETESERRQVQQFVYQLQQPKAAEGVR